MNINSQEISGSVNYYAGMWFKMFHHEHFSFNAKRGKMEYNKTPLVDDTFSRIEDFSLLNDGFSFTKINKNKKQMVTCQDKTLWENTLTKYLFQYIRNFSFSKEDVKGTAFNALWSPTGTINTFFFPRGEDGLAFRRVEDKLHIESRDSSINKAKVLKISFKTDSMVILTSQGMIDYKYKIQPDIWEFIKSIFEIGYADLLDIQK